MLKTILLRAAAVLALPMIALVIAGLSAIAVLAFVLTFFFVYGIAVFRPSRRFGLGNKVFNAVMAVWIGMSGLVAVGVAREVEAQRSEMAELRTTDPAAYLAMLRGIDEQRWRSELAVLDPVAFQEEEARLAAEEAEHQRLADERDAVAAEEARIAAEAAERARIAAVEAEAQRPRDEQLAEEQRAREEAEAARQAEAEAELARIAAAEADVARHQAEIERIDANIRSLIEHQQWDQALRQWQALEGLEPEDLIERRAEVEARVAALVRPLPAANIEGNLAGYRLLSALAPDNASYAERIGLYEARQEAADRESHRAAEAPQSSGGAISQARELLYNWQPVSVALNAGVLTIVLPQRQITQPMYSLVISAGICLGPLTGQTLPGVRTVEVLNEFSYQGFVYEAGTQYCDEMNAVSAHPRRVEILILARTHTYSRFRP